MSKVPGSIAVPSNAPTDVLQVSQQLSWLASALNNWVALVAAYLTPGQYTGTSTNDNATAGNVGEYVSSVIPSGSAILLSGTTNITSISLTAGDWDVSGEVWAVGSAATATVIGGGIETVNNSFASVGDATARTNIPWNGSTPGTIVFPFAPCRVSLAATTTYYLNVSAALSAGSISAYGKLSARRAR